MKQIQNFFRGSAGKWSGRVIWQVAVSQGRHPLCTFALIYTLRRFAQCCTFPFLLCTLHFSPFTLHISLFTLHFDFSLCTFDFAHFTFLFALCTLTLHCSNLHFSVLSQSTCFAQAVLSLLTSCQSLTGCSCNPT